MNRFISEKDVEEAKQKRQEEWAKAREEGRELPKEEEEVMIDNRSLYERLKEQKDRKQEEFEDQLKFKNMIYKGLNEEDHSFLSTVAKKQAEMDAKRFDLESEELKTYRAALEDTAVDTTIQKIDIPQKPRIAQDFVKKRKSQSELLSGIVRKKKNTSSANNEEAESKTKLDNEQQEKPGQKDVDKQSEETSMKQNKGLISLAAYPSSSDDEDDEDNNDGS